MDDLLSSEEMNMLLDKNNGEEIPKESEQTLADFAEFTDFGSNKETSPQITGNLDLILDVPLKISVVLGKAKKSIKEITNIVPGTVIELDKSVDEPLEIYANGKKIAEGEAVVINEKFCIRITKIVSKRELFSKL